MLRALAIHLLGQYVAKGSAAPMSVSFDEIKENYRQLSTVNIAMSERIRAAVTRDAAVNAVVILESFVFMASDNIDYGFEQLQGIFLTESD